MNEERRKKHNQHQPVGRAEQQLIDGGSFSISCAITTFSPENFEKIVPQTLPPDYAYFVLADYLRACALSHLEELEDNDEVEVVATEQADWTAYRSWLQQQRQNTHDEWAKRAVFTESDSRFLSAVGVAPLNSLTGFKLGELESLVERISRHAPPVTNGTMNQIADSIIDSFDRLSPAEQEAARKEMHRATTGKEMQPRKSFDESLNAGDLEFLLDIDAADCDRFSGTLWFQGLIRRRVLRGAPFAREHEARIRAMKLGYPW